MLHAVDPILPVESSFDNIVSEDELIEFLLKVVVLKSKDVCMVLQSMELLLVAMAGLQLLLVARPDSLKLTTQTHQLIVELNEFALRRAEVIIELNTPLALSLFLLLKLPLAV